MIDITSLKKLKLYEPNFLIVKKKDVILMTETYSNIPRARSLQNIANVIFGLILLQTHKYYNNYSSFLP